MTYAKRPKLCEVEGCHKPVKGYGICDNHIKKLYRGTLDTTSLSLTPKQLHSAEDIMKYRVDKTGDCWIWTGAIDRMGYGALRWNGKRVFAHRWVYEKHRGAIPEGLDLDHECHNRDLSCPGRTDCRHRACVNPNHLKPKTRQENLLGANTAARRAYSKEKGEE